MRSGRAVCEGKPARRSSAAAVSKLLSCQNHYCHSPQSFLQVLQSLSRALSTKISPQLRSHRVRVSREAASLAAVNSCTSCSMSIPGVNAHPIYPILLRKHITRQGRNTFHHCGGQNQRLHICEAAHQTSIGECRHGFVVDRHANPSVCPI